MGSTPIIGTGGDIALRPQDESSGFKSVTDRLFRNEMAERFKAAEANLCAAYDRTLTEKFNKALSGSKRSRAQVQGAANSCPQPAS